MPSTSTRAEHFVLASAKSVSTTIGDREVDDESETWIDHDPDCHGDPLDLRLMDDPVHEDGYIMSCCDRRPYELGCVISRHKPKI